MTSPLSRLADLVFFMPLGIAVRAAEEIPKLAAQGRERFSAQAPLAHMVGKMAVEKRDPTACDQICWPPTRRTGGG